MGEKDQRQFIDAVTKAKSTFIKNWGPAVDALSRLAMFDMLPALDAIDEGDRGVIKVTAAGMLTKKAFSRIVFAINCVSGREICDLGIPEDEINDGREFLGCTRLDEDGVKKEIESALNEARIAIRDGKYADGKAVSDGVKGEACCGAVHAAWVPILVGKRRAKPGASLISNLAAAAHYMLARYHVCAAKASQWQMKQVIDGYDVKKRWKIGTGDRNLSSMALTPGNPPFPPDFAIRNWAYKGAAEGDVDRLRCNSDADRPLLFPEVNGSEA